MDRYRFSNILSPYISKDSYNFYLNYKSFSEDIHTYMSKDNSKDTCMQQRCRF